MKDLNYYKNNPLAFFKDFINKFRCEHVGEGCKTCTAFCSQRVVHLYISRDDPVKHCIVYTKEGCAHVDGILCDMKTCNILRDYKLENEPCPHCGHYCTGKTVFCTKGL